MANTTDLQKFKFNIEPQTKFETLNAEYKSITDQIKKEIGSLEEIRTRLALSRRAICKLLMVDPSAWTRWTKSKDGVDAPPHIYQALKWYLQLIGKNPDVHAPLQFEQKMELLRKDSALEIARIKKEFQDYLKNNPKGELVHQESSLEKVAEVLSENFKKFSETLTQNADPKKALELEIIKYDNKKLQEKIVTLESKLGHVVAVNEKLSATLDKLTALQEKLALKVQQTPKATKVKVSKNRPAKKGAKVLKNQKQKIKANFKKFALKKSKKKKLKSKIKKGRPSRF